MTTTVADVMADGLVRAGARRVFRASGATAGDVLVDAFQRRGLTVLDVAGASAACEMAALSGALDATPGVAVIGDDIAGATQGLAYAFLDRLPAVVIVSGDTVRASADAAASPAMVKGSLTVGASSAAHWIAHACRLAMTEPWGPVRLDVAAAIAAAAAVPLATETRPSALPAPDSAALAAAARLLGAAERPLVVAGRLCRSPADGAWLRAFAEARPAPVLVTPKGRGVLPDPHPLVIGMLDGGESEREALASADLLVAVGLDPVEIRPGSWPDEAAVLQLSPVASEPLGPRALGATVVGDIGLILEELAPRLRDVRLAEWDVARLHALKQRAAAPPAAPDRLVAFRVVEAARRLTPAGTLAVFDTGDDLAAASRAWSAVVPGECLTATGHAAGGFVARAIVAAQLARSDRRAIGFTTPIALMAAREALETVARLGLPVLLVVLGQAVAPALALPAGLRRFRAASAEAFTPAFEAALVAGGPAVVEIPIDQRRDEKEG